MDEKTNSRSGSLRVAFVGTGQMARLHLRALRRVPTPYHLVGAHDQNESAAGEFAALAHTQAYQSIDQLFGEGRPELVHICTPAGRHFDPARRALLAGAHVYIEKPVVESHHEAVELLAIARQRGLLVCGGHQLLRDPAYLSLIDRASRLGPLSLIDSHFAFRPPQLKAHTASPRAMSAQLLDIVPHPLYLLIGTFERFAADPASLELVSGSATPTDLHALFRAGSTFGRLSVSLQARPVASSLSVYGAGGGFTADFVRAMVIGAGNPGTEALEKIANPIVEGWQLGWRTVRSLSKRLMSGGDYPGLAELLGAFYESAAGRGAPPMSAEHLDRVTRVYEQLAETIRASVGTSDMASSRPVGGAAESGRIAVLTGARGFLGKEIARALTERGIRVRGIGRGGDPEDPNIPEWLSLDLGRGLNPKVLQGAEVVVHAAAETSGGYEAHQRNSIDATRNVVSAMKQAGISRLVYISTLSVLRPPKTPWEVQNEATPMPADPKSFGAYAWGKTLAERIIAEEAPGQGISTRILRPAALVDWRDIELPGLLGRRLFGTWHLGLGRPSLPMAIIDVGLAGEVIAWSADRFEEAPAVVNLMDASLMTRREIFAAFRRRGWSGRVIWVPISMMAGLVMVIKTLISLARFQRPGGLAAWSVLRPRRYDPGVSQRLLARLQGDGEPTEPARRGASALAPSGS